MDRPLKRVHTDIDRLLISTGVGEKSLKGWMQVAES